MTDTFKKPTELGLITVSKEAIGQIISAAAEHRKGRLYLANSKGRTSGIAISLGIGDAMDAIDVVQTEEGLVIKAYIIVRFGASIKKETAIMREEICKNLQQLTGEEPAKITLVVAGTLSRQIVRRNIEVVWERGNQ